MTLRSKLREQIASTIYQFSKMWTQWPPQPTEENSKKKKKRRKFDSDKPSPFPLPRSLPFLPFSAVFTNCKSSQKLLLRISPIVSWGSKTKNKRHSWHEMLMLNSISLTSGVLVSYKWQSCCMWQRTWSTKAKLHSHINHKLSVVHLGLISSLSTSCRKNSKEWKPALQTK